MWDLQRHVGVREDAGRHNFGSASLAEQACRLSPEPAAPSHPCNTKDPAWTAALHSPAACTSRNDSQISCGHDKRAGLWMYLQLLQSSRLQFSLLFITRADSHKALPLSAMGTLLSLPPVCSLQHGRSAHISCDVILGKSKSFLASCDDLLDACQQRVRAAVSKAGVQEERLEGRLRGVLCARPSMHNNLHFTLNLHA